MICPANKKKIAKIQKIESTLPVDWFSIIKYTLVIIFQGEFYFFFENSFLTLFHFQG